MSRHDDLSRIHEALLAAADTVRPFTPGAVAFRTKSERGDPVTAADHAIDDVLRELLPTDGDGWLSEETTDDPARLACRRVWIVDPLDGTREFVDGVPEWCVSIGLVEAGRPVAGGILNPVTGETVLGSLETGVTYNGEPAPPPAHTELDGAIILASRSEIRRGEWDRFRSAPFQVRPCGSVAYKLALVAAGQADGTWTLVPKSEWDVAAGVALVTAAGGRVAHRDGSTPRFNQARPRFPNLVAMASPPAADYLDAWLNAP